MNAEWEFLAMLKDEGRWSAGWFLAEHAEDLGKRSTDDIDALLEEC
jgi:NTE family protein